MADELDPAQADQQRQPKEESVVERWRQRRIKRGYAVYRVRAQRKLVLPALENILTRRLAQYGASEDAAPALQKRKRFRIKKRR